MIKQNPIHLPPYKKMTTPISNRKNYTHVRKILATCADRSRLKSHQRPLPKRINHPAKLFLPSKLSKRLGSKLKRRYDPQTPCLLRCAQADPVKTNSLNGYAIDRSFQLVNMSKT